MGNTAKEFKIDKDCLSIDKFKKELIRKMTIHIISNRKEDCKSLAEFLSGEKFKYNSNELLEKNIKNKINIFSFINYLVYRDINQFIEKLEEKVEESNHQTKILFSEVVIVLENPNIQQQKEELKNVLNRYIFRPYLYPFVIFISPQNLDLNGFKEKMVFQYKTCLRNIRNYQNMYAEVNNEESNQIFELFRRINVLFSYYNELGDEFSFYISENKDKKNKELKKVEVENEKDYEIIPVYINILLLGKTGAGKSTLLNLILDEKKSFEGGSCFSSTTKNILVYKKRNVPIRFYDVKGIENDETRKNYINLLQCHNGNDDTSKYSINAILYCISYTDGIKIEEEDYVIFDELIEFNIPVLFVITHMNFNPTEVSNGIIRLSRDNIINEIENGIKSLLKKCFEKKHKIGYDKFFRNYVKIYYTNLVRKYTTNPPLPIFGIDNIISYFTELVSEDDWSGLKRNCEIKNEELCQMYSRRNPFLRYYSEINKIRERNKVIAKKSIKRLKTGAFFTGMVPGLDIGMEYYYKNEFTKELKALYGYDINSNQNIDDKIDNQITNKGKNTLSVVRGVGNIGTGIAMSIIPTAGVITTEIGINISRTVITQTAANLGTFASRLVISTSTKMIGWILLPVTCIGFGIWSNVKIDKDCEKILSIFDESFNDFRFNSLLQYINSFLKAIQYLRGISQKIIEDDQRNN